MLFDKGQRSILAWYLRFSICFFNPSLSMADMRLGSIAGRLRKTGMRFKHTPPQLGRE